MNLNTKMPIEKSIIVVSGLPRSGTSLMMQILQACGIPVLSDHSRPADEHNPRGYFEFQAVKTLKHDPTWLSMAVGKAVKIVSHLLFYLPNHFHYKIIFMLRHLDEVIHSQNKMLKNEKTNNVFNVDPTLKIQLMTHLLKVHQWMQSQKQIEFVQIHFNQLFSTPESELLKLTHFLNIQCDLNNILPVLDSKLYRSRSQ